MEINALTSQIHPFEEQLQDIQMEEEKKVLITLICLRSKW